MVANRWVSSAVRAPMRAAAAAASQPAWPPPTTMTSKRAYTSILHKGCRVLSGAGRKVKAKQGLAVSRETCSADSLTNYLPMQKSRKITSRMSSTSTRPVSRPRLVAAERNSSAMSSSLPAAPCAKARSSAETVCSSDLSVPCPRDDASSPLSKNSLARRSERAASRASIPRPVAAEIDNLQPAKSWISIHCLSTAYPQSNRPCFVSPKYLILNDFSRYHRRLRQRPMRQ